jgi:acyl-CoA thioesterase I
MHPMLARSLPLFALLTLAACGSSSDPAGPEAGGLHSPEGTPAETSAAHEPLVVFFGDSLTAGPGLGKDEAWPARIEEALAADGSAIRAVNAGVSGDTTAGGVSRLDWILRQDPDVLVVELGANDGLRGLPLEETETNLRTILLRAKEKGARVLLAGMQLPPNYGPESTHDFQQMYIRLAKDEQVTLVPFLLEGVGGDPSLNLADGLHPNAEGHRRIAQTVLPYLRKLLPTH